MSGSSLRDWLLTSGSNGITNEALVDELVGAFKKQGISDSNYSDLLVNMPLQVEEFISVCPELTFGARQFLRSCYQTHLAVEFDTLSVECLRGERRGQYLIVYEVTCPGGEIATGCSRGDGLDTGHAMKPGQMRLDFTPKDVRLRLPHFGFGEEKDISVEILLYEIDNKEQTAVVKRSFGVYSDNSAQSQENRFLRRLSQGVNVSQNVLRNASPFVPDILGVKTGLNLVSEIPSVVKMLGSADKNDLVGKMSLSIPIRRDKQNIKYRWKVPKSKAEEMAAALADLSEFRKKTLADVHHTLGSAAGRRAAAAAAASAAASAEASSAAATASESEAATDEAKTKSIGRRFSRKIVQPPTKCAAAALPTILSPWATKGDKTEDGGEELVDYAAPGVILEHEFISETGRTHLRVRLLFTLVQE